MSISLSSLARDLIDIQTPTRGLDDGPDNIVMTETVNYISSSKLLLSSQGAVEVIENTDLEAG
jgi:hypothetical protein